MKINNRINLNSRMMNKTITRMTRITTNKMRTKKLNKHLLQSLRRMRKKKYKCFDFIHEI